MFLVASAFKLTRSNLLTLSTHAAGMMFGSADDKQFVLDALRRFRAEHNLLDAEGV